MGVPNTSTFSLQDVVDEINPTTDDLVDCIADATSADYSSTYYTSPATSLLEFRNYAGTANVTILSSDTITTTSSSYSFNLGIVPVGDMIILTVFQQTGTPTTPSGYTLRNSAGTSASSFDNVFVYTRVSTVSTTQSVTIASTSVYKIINAIIVQDQSDWGANQSFAVSGGFTPVLTGLVADSLVFMAWSTKHTSGGTPTPTLNMESGIGSYNVISDYPSSGSYRAWITYYFQPSATSDDRFLSFTQGIINKTSGVMFEIKN
jgi:hypothetical protein